MNQYTEELVTAITVISIQGLLNPINTMSVIITDPTNEQFNMFRYLGKLIQMTCITSKRATFLILFFSEG